MQVYAAAVYSNNYMRGQNRYVKLTDREREILDHLNASGPVLESWHYVGKQQYVDAMRAEGARIFLDSGAFSAYTLGVKLDIRDYVSYIKRNADILRNEDGVVMASVLDGIGDPLQTWRNQLEMEELGFRPLPCFHAGEDERYLEHYVRNYEYITLGGMVGTSTKQLTIWLDRMWNRYLVDGSGNPKIKVHGFGITAIPIMERYPWFSVDSSSWIQTAAFGGIMTPQWGPISVSEKSPSRHDAGQHACNLTPIEQQQIFDMLDSVGFSYERLSTVYESRAAFNIWCYGMLNIMMQQRKKKAYNHMVQELF